MNRYITRRDPVVPRRPQRIELPHESGKWIVLALILTLAAAMVFLAIYFMSFLPSGAGWHQIEAPNSATGCQVQYAFQYNLGKNGDATVENKTISALYTQATDEAWKALSDTEYTGVNNLYTMNVHPNEPVQVDAILYSALKQLDGNRIVFRAPLYAYYDGLYHCANDVDAAEVDPVKNQAAADYVSSLAAYSESCEDISLDFLNDGQVRLNVSQRYLDFAQENELGSLVDFGWIRNAFVLDHAAALLTERGYTDGTISSFDGFTRSLGGDDYAVNLFGMVDGEARQIAAAHFAGPMAQVCFRAMPLYDLDENNYYTYEDGTVCTPYVGADGWLHSSCDSLLLLSAEEGCAALAAKGLTAYTADMLNESDLTGLNWVSVKGSTVHQGGAGFTVEQ